MEPERRVVANMCDLRRRSCRAEGCPVQEELAGSNVNRWNIPRWLELEVLARDTKCVYCGIDFSLPSAARGAKPSWEHIVNDERIINRENIARCCMSCNASKGAMDLRSFTRTTAGGREFRPASSLRLCVKCF